ncbi:hypothetical protein MmiHf6_13920 [Methanimicrococcus hongohii]|uniref:Uncharacterized protein n=1 Tax=Methanimicrococcus hongohii TaxID=3028295 RepID=A0AA96ZUS0_9EURY|nr:hypothetical protein [Methanimicrococcus sp. Hf6]WNY24067.1 hypothetical protein MmiHf6_13920 [Methanimicrococcus sp. Hf6]
MERPFLFALLIVIMILMVIISNTIYDAVFIILAIAFLFLICYNIPYLLENPLFYIFTRSNEYFPPRYVEMMISAFSGIFFAFIFLFVPSILYMRLNIYNFIFNALEMLDLTETVEGLLTLNNYFLISAFFSIVLNILFLKMLKKLLLNSNRERISRESEL